ncbi:DUF6901 family protein [Fluviispira sanaruensis]|uniref:Uncharacterized protein n=1 Tax=Fluviispira sanaruensis TaxID=2493639 RepID=A0A4P2VHA1_FLUSA|nr:hypothetical protein [Fluviispira sanaruensis]BBH52333.1 hypothetical protein JCM31447_07740 [Fluviispira sanaruensis]
MDKIIYKFIFMHGKEIEYVVDLNRIEGDKSQNSLENVDWTDLDFNKCSVCPLSSQSIKKCPAAIDVQQMMTEFRDVLSTDIVKVSVESQHRFYFKECDAQTGLKALVGLVMATSSCPILKQFKGLAFYHLPFASIEETSFRAISSYLLKQFFIAKNNGVADWELNNFSKFYDTAQNVNESFFQRIKVASKADANLNAIVAFSSQSMILSITFDDLLEELRKQMME